MPKPAPLNRSQLGQTLVDKLSRTVADVRQLATMFGIRPYRVWVLRGNWSGTHEGEGDFTVTEQFELLPTPKVLTWDATTRPADPAGSHEMGDVKLDYVPYRSGPFEPGGPSGPFNQDISIGYTEDDLRGHCITKPLTATEQVFYDIQEDGGLEATVVNLTPVRRRFKLIGVPNLEKGRVCWTVHLRKSETDTQFTDVGQGVPP